MTKCDLNTHAEFKKRLIAGEAPVAEFQSMWEAFKQAREQITAELMSKSKSALRIPSGVTKAEGVRRIVYNMETVFALAEQIVYSPFGPAGDRPTTQIEAVARIVAETDQARLDAYAEAHRKSREDAERALNDPQTLEDFELFRRAKGINALTDEQFARYDELLADEEEDAINRTRGDAAVKSVDLPDGVELNLIEGWHEKRSCSLFIVQISERVDRAVYDELLAKAKMLGGWYSNFVKRQAGFQFLEKENAERFMALARGQDADRSDILREIEDGRVGRRADRLEEGSGRILARAGEEMACDRLANTPRRAAMAAAAEEATREEAYLADVMAVISERMRAGEARWFSKVKAATEVEALLELLHEARRQAEVAKDTNDAYERSFRPTKSADIRHAVYPWPSLHVANLEEVATALVHRSGHKKDATKVLKLIRAARAKDRMVIKTGSHQDAAFFVDFAKDGRAVLGRRFHGEMLERSMETYKRVTRMGLTSPAMMRCALRELTAILPDLRAADPIKEAERALVGVPIPGFFPTTPELAGEVVECLGIEDDGEGIVLLEPEAGKCDLAAVVIAAFPKARITCVEISPMLARIGRMKGFDVREADFMEWEPGKKFDRIVMNPPFEEGADMLHIKRAFRLLNPGGRLVAIMANRETEDFRIWRESVGGTVINVVDGAFRRAERSTGVTVRIVLIEAAGAAPVDATIEEHAFQAAA